MRSYVFSQLLDLALFKRMFPEDRIQNSEGVADLVD